MSTSKRIIEETLLGEKLEVTDEIVAYYREHPQDLDLIIDKEYFYSRFIQFFFLLGLVITISSRLLKFFFQNTWAAFINDLVLDVFSELGIAIFGGSITAYILERMKKKQFQENVKFRSAILQRLEESNQSEVSNSNSPNHD